jgi:hypothetical protein
MFLTTYYLSLLQVQQAHAKQDAQMKGITSGDIIITESKSCGAAATSIVSITIAKPTCLRTIYTQVGIVASIPRSITLVSVMLVHCD